jgi:hypothetical protein
MMGGGMSGGGGYYGDDYCKCGAKIFLEGFRLFVLLSFSLMYNMTPYA